MQAEPSAGGSIEHDPEVPPPADPVVAAPPPPLAPVPAPPPAPPPLVPVLVPVPLVTVADVASTSGESPHAAASPSSAPTRHPGLTTIRSGMIRGERGGLAEPSS